MTHEDALAAQVQGDQKLIAELRRDMDVLLDLARLAQALVTHHGMIGARFNKLKRAVHVAEREGLL